MSIRLLVGVLLGVIFSLLSGCTTRAWYETMQATAKQACRKEPPSEQERCEARLNRMEYEQYEKQRAAR